MTFISLLRQAVIVHRCIELGEPTSAEVARRARIDIIAAQEWLNLFRAQSGGSCHENH